MGTDSSDIVAKLKEKHARLKENKLLRSPNPSRQGSFKSVKSPRLQHTETGHDERSPGVNRLQGSGRGKVRFESVSSYGSSRDNNELFDILSSVASAEMTSQSTSRTTPEEPDEISWIGWCPPDASAVKKLGLSNTNKHSNPKVNQHSLSHKAHPMNTQTSKHTDALTVPQEVTPELDNLSYRYGSSSIPHMNGYPDVRITRMPLRTDLRSASPGNKLGRTNPAYVRDEDQFSHKTVISLVNEDEGYCTLVRLSEDGTTASKQTKM